MKVNNYKIGLVLIFLLSSIFVFGQARKNYFGEINNSDSLKLFGKNIVSTGMYDRDMIFSKDGKEAYWGIFHNGICTICFSELVNGEWTKPQVAPFASDPNFFYLEPALSPDSKKIYFLSTKNPEGKKPLPGWGYQNIWCSEKDKNGKWQEAYMLPGEINSDQKEYFPSVSSDGTLYFTRAPKQGRETKLFMSEFKNGKFQKAVEMPAEINSFGHPYNAAVSADGNFIVSCVFKHPDSKSGQSDYILFKRNKNKKWQKGILLGEQINLPGKNAISQSFSPDGKYMFFAVEKNRPFKEYSIDEFKRKQKNTQNGLSDIYWIETNRIKEFKD